MKKTLIALSILLLVGCSTPPTLPPPAIPTLAAQTSTLPPASPTPSPAPADTPLPPPTREPTTLALGEPFLLGRGKIVKAVFLPGADRVAIAWGSGVSLHEVATGQELWFQPAAANLVAFDVQPGGKTFAAALTDGSLELYDAADGATRRIGREQSGANQGDIAWSPDGHWLAAAGEDGTLVVWPVVIK